MKNKKAPFLNALNLEQWGKVHLVGQIQIL